MKVQRKIWRAPRQEQCAAVGNDKLWMMDYGGWPRADCEEMPGVFVHGTQ